MNLNYVVIFPHWSDSWHGRRSYTRKLRLVKGEILSTRKSYCLCNLWNTREVEKLNWTRQKASIKKLQSMILVTSQSVSTTSSVLNLIELNHHPPPIHSTQMEPRRSPRFIELARLRELAETDIDKKKLLRYAQYKARQDKMTDHEKQILKESCRAAYQNRKTRVNASGFKLTMLIP
ncbi:hypothetical protein MKW98_001703 [Papaver atlanticum]|uniref:Uncharacterized protein n=1 Tax=Papaver atlanticum TaxID=357466 RepID=A0AAD4X911_9MAGN|nr:hypothetical protein MKW98_001703 [Papaver atlanticum]